MGKQKVLLPKSSVSGKSPVASAMTYGELYINYASGTNTAFLATKKSDGTIAKFFEGGEINVQPNWSETATTSDAYILNKPTVPSAGTATPINIATAATVGTSTKYAREDHKHKITLATGDANGQVKIAGTNVNVKGLGSAAYTNSGAYATFGAYISSSGQTYLTCSNASGATALTISQSSYKLEPGAIVMVRFSNDVPSGATLNINSKGAKSIWYYGAALESGLIKSGDTVSFMYSNDHYHLMSIDRWGEDLIPLVGHVTMRASANTDFITEALEVGACLVDVDLDLDEICTAIDSNRQVYLILYLEDAGFDQTADIKMVFTPKGYATQMSGTTEIKRPVFKSNCLVGATISINRNSFDENGFYNDTNPILNAEYDVDFTLSPNFDEESNTFDNVWQMYGSRNITIEELNKLRNIQANANYGFNNIQINGVTNIVAQETNGIINFRNVSDIIVSAISSSITISAQPKLKNAIDTDYGTLYSMVHGGALTVGQVYMISDYVTRVDGNLCDSYGKPFALLVTAIANDKLSCIAFAFDKDGVWPSSNLDKWVLWYDIENDTTKYNWAINNGRGVIYRMIDEFGNDCPYDFKNIYIRHPETVFPLAVGAEGIIHQGLPIPTFSYFNKGAYSELSMFGGARDNYIAPQYSGTTLLFPQIAITVGSTQTPAAPSIVKNKFSCFRFGLYSQLVSGNTFDDAIRCEITANGSVCGNKIGPGFYQNNVLCADYFNNNIIESDCTYCTFSGDQKSRITVSSNVIGNHCSNISAFNHWTNNIIHDLCSDLTFQNFSENGNTGGYRYWVVESDCHHIDIYPDRDCPEFFRFVTIRSSFGNATINPARIYGSVSNPARIVFGLLSGGNPNLVPYLEDVDTVNSNLTIGNGVLTIKTGATPSLSGGFSANQSSNKSFTLHKVVQTGKVGDLTNNAGYITSGVASLTNFATSANVVNAINSLSGSYVTLNTVQTITAKKTFASGITINNPSSAIVSDITYTTCGSTCHQQYDGVNKCLKFVFD